MAAPYSIKSRAFRVAPDLAPADEQSLMRRVAGSVLSGAAKVGNVIDLPGSSVRDVLAWENPFDQWFPWNWTSSDNRVSGRDLLERYNLIGQNTPGLDAGDIAGLGAEIGTDPFFWISGPSRALTTAGTVAERAGLLGRLSEVTGRSIGPRAGRIGTTLDDVLGKLGPEATESAGRAAGHLGVPLDSIRGERLGGLAAIGPPVGRPWAVLGSSDSSLPIARTLDAIGAAVRWSPPVRAAYQMFGGGSLQTGTRIGQETANAAVEGRRAALSKSRMAISEIATKLQSKGVLSSDPFEAGNQLYRWIEGHELAPSEIADLIHGARDLSSSLIDDAQEWGLKREMLDDPEIPFFTHRAKVESRTSRSSRPFSVEDEMGFSRQDILRSGEWGAIYGGTETLRKMSREAAELIDAFQAAGMTATADDVTQWIGSRYGSAVTDDYSKWLPTQSAWEPATGRHNRLAKMLLSEHAKDPDVLRAGLYVDPITSLERYTERSLDVIETAKATLHTLADDGAIDIARRSAAIAEEVSLVDLLHNLKFDMTTEPGRGALNKLADLRGMGETVDDIAMRTVPRELADDLTRMSQAFSGPEPTNIVMRLVDSVTGITKAGQTSLWPAFHVRNLFSGQMRNWIAGMFDPRSVADTWSMIRGGTIRGASEIPYVAKTLRDRGLSVTDEAATDLLREMAYAYGVTGRGQGEALARAVPDASTTAGSILSQFPGGYRGTSPFSLRETGRQALGLTPDTQRWRPWDVRGFGERTASTWGPAVAGESVAEITEDLNRISPFIAQLKRGIDPQRAAEKILAAQVDYSSKAYSAFERQIAQRVFPYWRFNSRQIPYVARELFERPGGLMGQTVRAMNAGRDDSRPMPQHIADTAAVPLGHLPDGSDRYLTGFGLMEEAALAIDPTSPRSAMLQVASQLNPMVRAPMEWMTGESFFQAGPGGGRDLDDLDPLVGRTARNIQQTLSGETGYVAPYRLPQSVEFLVSNSPISRFLSTARTLTDPRKDVGTRLLNVGTGVRISDVSPGAQDAVIRDALTEMMKDSGANTYAKVYYPGGPQTPEQIEYMAMMNLLAERQKRRKAE